MRRHLRPVFFPLLEVEAPARLIPGLASVKGVYWLRHSDATGLMSFLRAIAVWYDPIEVEFKRCVNCYRPLIDNAATALRLVYDVVPDRSMIKCGQNCDRDNESGVWRTLGVKAAA
jgi:hypothetical protein